MTIRKSNSPSEIQTLNTQAASKHQETEGQSKITQEIPVQTSRDQGQMSAKSSEYRGGSSRGRRTGNKSSRGRDTRRAGTGTVPTQISEKPAARNGGARRSDIMQRAVRNDARQPQGAVISRTIYTSDRRLRSVGDDAKERLSSSNMGTPVAVTG